MWSTPGNFNPQRLEPVVGPTDPAADGLEKSRKQEDAVTSSFEVEELGDIVKEKKNITIVGGVLHVDGVPVEGYVGISSASHSEYDNNGLYYPIFGSQNPRL